MFPLRKSLKCFPVESEILWVGGNYAVGMGLLLRRKVFAQLLLPLLQLSTFRLITPVSTRSHTSFQPEIDAKQFNMNTKQSKQRDIISKCKIDYGNFENYILNSFAKVGKSSNRHIMINSPTFHKLSKIHISCLCSIFHLVLI